MSKETVRVNFEFPQEHYPYFKLLCAKRKQTMREFMTEMVLKEIEKSEDVAFAKLCENRSLSRQEDDLIDWDEATRLAGW